MATLAAEFKISVRGIVVRYPVAKLAAISFGLLVLAACGSGGSSPEAKVALARPLKAEVCTEGEARGTKLYVRNLDDFEWRDISISLVKDGETYAREWASLSSESQQASEPFTDSTQFSFLKKVERIQGPATVRSQRRADTASWRTRTASCDCITSVAWKAPR